MSGSTFWLSSPRGPFTLTTFLSDTVTVTPAGRFTGNLPILDIVLFFNDLRLVDIAQHLAAHVLLTGLGVGHDAFRRGNDGDAQAVQNAGHVRNRRIAAQTRAAYALEVLDGVGLGGGVSLQSDFDRRMTFLVLVEFVSENITLLIEDLGHLLLNF